MEWISVKNRLPEPNVDVLVNFNGWDDLEFQRVLEYCPIDNIFFDWRGEEYNLNISTHWMPLPKPPTQ